MDMTSPSDFFTRSPLLPSSAVFQFDSTHSCGQSVDSSHNLPYGGCSLESVAVSGSQGGHARRVTMSAKDFVATQYHTRSQSRYSHNHGTRGRKTSYDGGRPATRSPNPNRNRPVYTRYHSDSNSILPFSSNRAATEKGDFQGFAIPFSFKTRSRSPTVKTLLSPTPASLRPRLPPMSSTPTFWLILYFTLNLSLTLYNKSLLTAFPFPYTLTALHTLSGTIGGRLLHKRGWYSPKLLGKRDVGVLVGFSVLYAINIGISNVSLHTVTVPFHQVIRASTPIFTIALSALLFGTSCSKAKILSLVPVMFGVTLATYGDYYFTMPGLILTLFGTFLASLKAIYTNILQSRSRLLTSGTSSPIIIRFPGVPIPVPPRLNLHPLDLLTRMSPLAFIQCIFYAYISGELQRLRDSDGVGLGVAGVLGVNAVLAFALNVVSFTASGKAGALSMCVAANVKQVLTVLLAVTIFNLTITKMNVAGIALTILGGAWYARVDWIEKNGRST